MEVGKTAAEGRGASGGALCAMWAPPEWVGELRSSVKALNSWANLFHVFRVLVVDLPIHKHNIAHIMPILKSIGRFWHTVIALKYLSLSSLYTTSHICLYAQHSPHYSQMYQEFWIHSHRSQVTELFVRCRDTFPYKRIIVHMSAALM